MEFDQQCGEIYPASGRILLEIYQLDKEQFSFAVTDSGIGIPEKDQRKIFDMFYQAENSKEKKRKVAGLAYRSRNALRS